MSRPPSSRIAQRHDTLLERRRVLKAAHPCWGDRRLWASRRVVEPLPVHKKRLLRLMPEPHRLVTPQQRLKAKRTPMRSTPTPTRPHAWWGLDMTKVMVPDVGWVSIVVVLDWSTKMVVGYQADLRSTARHGLAALDRAVHRQFPDGVRGKGLSLMRDHGCQPTSGAFMQACSTLGMHQPCTSDTNPTGHADTERLMRTRPEECLWLHEWTCPFT